VLDVIGTFQRVQQKVPSRLILVGDGPERGKVEQYCREHRICGAISFIGSFPLVEEVLVGADLFLLPSESESFGLSALEAMACEVPVVASDAGGLPEVVADGETGYLLPVGDVEGMAAAALKLLADGDLHRRFAAASRRRAVEVFGQGAVVGRYRAIYQRLTGLP
jgi:N-acetyl-alpha-D-glucosaminyl L-malate synthase BshA